MHNNPSNILQQPVVLFIFFLFCRAYFLVLPQFCQSDLYAYSRPGRIMLHL